LASLPVFEQDFATGRCLTVCQRREQKEFHPCCVLGDRLSLVLENNENLAAYFRSRAVQTLKRAQAIVRSERQMYLDMAAYWNQLADRCDPTGKAGEQAMPAPSSPGYE